MSRWKFDKDCKGCQPVIFETKTGTMLPDDDPNVVAARQLFYEQPRAVQDGWHRVTCLNSRDPSDLRNFGIFVELMSCTLAELRELTRLLTAFHSRWRLARMIGN